MAIKNATQVLSGNFGLVFLDGEEVGDANVNATITINYSEFNRGSDVDRRATGFSGEGTLSFNQVTSICSEIAKRYLSGQEPRFVIEASLADPSAKDKGIESYTLNNVSFDAIPVINWQKGELVNKELNFKFTPSDMQMNSVIA